MNQETVTERIATPADSHLLSTLAVLQPLAVGKQIIMPRYFLDLAVPMQIDEMLAPLVHHRGGTHLQHPDTTLNLELCHV